MSNFNSSRRRFIKSAVIAGVSVYLAPSTAAPTPRCLNKRFFSRLTGTPMRNACVSVLTAVPR
ncbi:hypothetical protein HL670_00635 [Serratia plymuthica]|nr:hypothetical protein HL670_00635 [Serratia plymuthica]